MTFPVFVYVTFRSNVHYMQIEYHCEVTNIRNMIYFHEF